MACSLQRIFKVYSRNGYFLFKPGQHKCRKDSLIGYGPLGSELRRHFINEWWFSTVTFGESIYPIISSEFTSTSLLSSFISKLRLFGSSQQYTVPYGIALITNNNALNQDSNDDSAVKEYCQLYFFVTGSDIEKWSVYWKRRRMKWWKQFSRYPERFTITESVGNECTTNDSSVTKPTKGVIEYAHPNEDKEQLEDIVVMSLQGGDPAHNSINDSAYYCIVTSMRVDSGLLTVIADAYRERKDKDEKKSHSLLKLHLRLCPLRVAVLPTDDCNVQSLFSHNLSRELRLAGIPSKCFTHNSFQTRVQQQDELGTPFRAITDKITLTNGILQLQDRNTGLLEPMESESLLMTVLGIYERFRDDN